MAGYSREHCMSNNAVDCLERGVLTISRIDKDFFIRGVKEKIAENTFALQKDQDRLVANADKLIETIKTWSLQELKNFVRDECYENEWHHTGKFYNETYYYEATSVAMDFYNKVFLKGRERPKNIKVESNYFKLSFSRDEWHKVGITRRGKFLKTDYNGYYKIVFSKPEIIWIVCKNKTKMQLTDKMTFDKKSFEKVNNFLINNGAYELDRWEYTNGDF